MTIRKYDIDIKEGRKEYYFNVTYTYKKKVKKESHGYVKTNLSYCLGEKFYSLRNKYGKCNKRKVIYCEFNCDDCEDTIGISKTSIDIKKNTLKGKFLEVFFVESLSGIVFAKGLINIPLKKILVKQINNYKIKICGFF